MSNDALIWFVKMYESKGPCELARMISKSSNTVSDAYKRVVKEIKKRQGATMDI